VFRKINFNHVFTKSVELPQAVLNRWTLRFRDSDFEDRFVREHLERDLPMSIVYMAIGIFAFVSYSVLDYLVLSDAEFLDVMQVRLIVSVSLFALILLCFIPRLHFAIQWILSACMLIPGAGIIAMTCMISQPFSHMYYAGLILTVIYCSNFLLLRFTFSAAVSLLLFGLYLYAAIVVNPLPDWALINNVFFLTVTIGWTVWTSYWSDFYIRSEFASRYSLIAEKRKSEELLVAAEAGNKAKSEFLAVMSHELRTPLNAIIGFAEVMQHRLLGPLENKKYDSYVTDIAESGHLLLSIINDILDLSKAEAGQLELNEDTVEINPLIEKSLRVFRDKTALAGINLDFDRAPGEPVLNVDSRQVRQILINLVSNAVKFTDTGGWVRVIAGQTEDGRFSIAVKDNGLGISDEDQARVLEPFVQVEGALSRENGGTGLGLPLVRKMIELHGGELMLESQLDVGTSVTVIFPAMRVLDTQGRLIQTKKAAVA